MKKWMIVAGLAATLAVGLGCALAGRDRAGSGEATDGAVSVQYERYELPNGLDVVLHVDRSDPIAAVTMTFHVGSSREL